MLFTGKIFETTNSSINGKIEVVKSLAFGTYISVGGLTQSGGIVYEIWKKTLGKIRKQKPDVKKCLILGLGGGSVSKVINKYWKDVNILGIEIDREMTRLGKKYLDLEKVEVKISDAHMFCIEESKTNNKYDLIIVDLYLGDNFPKQFEELKFLKTVKKLMSKKGIVVFNRLYYDRKRKESVVFANKLKGVFKNIEFFYPEANLMLVCFK